MRKNLCVALSVLSLGLLLTSGCAKDQVKPDEGIASKTSTSKASGQEQSAASQQSAAQQQAAQQQSSAQQQASAQQQSAAAQQQAAERAAAEKAAAAKAAQQAAEKAAAEKAAAAKAAQQADVLSNALKMINFEFDSYALSQQARDILYADAEYILKNYKGKLKLEGHCDERGSDEYNLALGENRAKAALNYLLTLGVPANQLSIISYGKERPLDPASTEEAWAKNRRVEFKIVK